MAVLSSHNKIEKEGRISTKKGGDCPGGGPIITGRRKAGGKAREGADDRAQ